MQYDINLNDARIGYKPDGDFSRVLFVEKSRKLNPRGAAFSSYSPAYISSNEQLQSIMQILKPAGKMCWPLQAVVMHHCFLVHMARNILIHLIYHIMRVWLWI